VLGIVSADKQWALAGTLARGFKRVKELQPVLAQQLQELREAALSEGVADLPTALAELVAAEAAGQTELSWHARYMHADQQVKAMGGGSAGAMSLSTLLPPAVALSFITASNDPKKRAAAVLARDKARGHIPELRGLGAVWEPTSASCIAAALELRQWHMRSNEAKVEECLVKINLVQRHKALDKNVTNSAARIAKYKK